MSRFRGTTCADATGSSPTHSADAVYERSGDDLRDGLYVALDPWGWNLFDLTPQPGKD